MAISWHSMINWSQKLFTFYSRLDRSVIIMYHHKLYLLLVILVVSCHAAFEETSRFMTDMLAMLTNNFWRRRSKYARSLPSQTSPSALQRSPPPQRRRLASPPGEDDGHDQLHAHRFWWRRHSLWGSPGNFWKNYGEQHWHYTLQSARTPNETLFAVFGDAQVMVVIIFMK